MDISYELYKVFYYVAKSLSFSVASKQLYISQSAVSQSIKTLEKKLGHPLFIRSTKKVFLTPEGELLLHHVEPAVNLLTRGETQLTDLSSLGGQLRIGASDTICRYFLVPYLQRFHKEFPSIHIKVTNQTSSGCVELLENNQVDLIVTNFPNMKLKSNQQLLHVKEFQDVFVANVTHFPLHNQQLELKDLQQYPVLMLDRKSTTSQFLHDLFEQWDLNLVPEVELSSNDLLIDLARIGLGIAFIPDYMLTTQLNTAKPLGSISDSSQSEELFVLQIKETLPKRELVCAYNEHLPTSQAAKEFLKYFLT